MKKILKIFYSRRSLLINAIILFTLAAFLHYYKAEHGSLFLFFTVAGLVHLSFYIFRTFSMAKNYK